MSVSQHLSQLQFASCFSGASKCPLCYAEGVVLGGRDGGE